jgi:nickel/cobalt transporter (NicO) family protein
LTGLHPRPVVRRYNGNNWSVPPSRGVTKVKPSMLSWLGRFGASGFWLMLSTGLASAHPLGNFTINHLAAVHTSPGGIAIAYTLDIAEIPTFQIMHADAGPWDSAQLRRWATREISTVRSGLRVVADGTILTLAANGAQARLRPGAGGLPTLYWTATFTANVPPGEKHRVVVEDSVYADHRIGWKDVVVSPQPDPTHRLTAYPSAAIDAPRHNDVARFVLSSSGVPSQIEVLADGAGSASAALSIARSSYLSSLFARPDQSAWLVALTIAIAFGLGALHGLEPGHGKALLAFTLVGARATVKQACILAASLTFAHTFAVLLLGVALFYLADFASESVFGWIALFSGTAVAIVGARSLCAAIAHARPDGGHLHVRPFAGSRPLTFSSAVVAAMSGGIAPCPAAIVVLLAALRLHRVGYGLALIVVFSLGIAAVLTVLGMAVVKSSSWLIERAGFDRFARYAPLLTAAIISLLGSIMLAQGFVQEGVAASPWVVAALVLAAIAAYAAVPRHRHGNATA